MGPYFIQNLLKRIFLAWVLISFSTQNVFAVTLPAEIGKIQKVFQGTNGKTIFLIEEAHVDYGAQKSIAAILNYLIRKESVKLILVEGGWGDVSLSYLRNYGTQKSRMEISEQYLKEGKISGEEYLDVTSDLSMQLWGIENPQLYAENMKAFLTLEEKKQAIEEKLGSLKKSFSLLQDKMLSRELSGLLKRRSAFEDQTLSLVDYLHTLRVSSQDFLMASYPMLQKIDRLSGDKAGFDAEKAQLEKRELIAALSRMLTKPEFEELQVLESKKSLESKLGTIETLIRTYRQYSQLQRQLTIQNLERYAQMLHESMKMDSGALFTELKAFEEKVFESKINSSEAHEFLKSFFAFGNLQKLFELKLTPEDYQKIANQKIDLFYWKSLPGNPGMPLLEEMAPAAKAFYESAQKREQAMVQNAVQKVKETSEEKMAMIVGGFHAETVFENFRTQGYRVIRISPRFEVRDEDKQHQRYFKILKEKWEEAVLPEPVSGQKESVLPLQTVNH